LQRAGDGRIAIGAAERIVQDAKLRVKKVKRLLGELGDTDESTALSIRFRRVRKRMETSRLDEENADLYGQLTLAVHDLNVLLSSAFYPGS
jgi:hypothetical protein